MYAVIRTGGKQYKVSPGQYLNVDVLELKLGEKADLPEVLMIGGAKTAIGTPTVAGARVTAIVTEIGRAKKILVFKKRRRQKYRKMRGHRQDFTRLFIESIFFDGQTAAAETKAQIRDPNRVKPEPKKTRAEKIAAGIGPTDKKGNPKAAGAKSAKAGTAKKSAAAKPGAKNRSASAKKRAGASKAKSTTKKK